jgi:carbonic anhydrase
MGHMPEDALSSLPDTVKNNLFLDLEESVREDINKIKSHNLVSDHIVVKGFIYDIEGQELVSITE